MSAVLPVAASDVPGTANSQHWVRRLCRNRNGRVGLILLGLVLLLGVASLTGLLQGDLTQYPADALRGPSLAHPLGTDEFGRDELSRLAAGVIASLRIAAASVSMATLAGATAGIVSGYLGGWTDRILSRIADIGFAFPALLLALVITAALGRGWLVTSVAIAVVYTPIFFRVARGPVLSVRSRDFILAGRALGFGRTRLVLRHVLPNVAAPIVVQIALAMSWAILIESTLSFLGLGTQPPYPSLGGMVADGLTVVNVAWWLVVFPSAAIVAAVIGLNLVGDGVRHVLDPREGR